ncbi:threonine/serine exporter [Robertmurraya yapensis]|uniref:Threonine/serine exporter n=2 Tax=Bacillaceae TaxID=186817 RepID=A0A3S0L872_9BACI|nr:threonine/serine exporter family protein [Bacillus yapensis]RTR29214.1 threonine/serine exporter [Bacillus yapensis]TKS94819.1 threonine/serine exporter family protein [Bacillus yapensis]
MTIQQEYTYDVMEVCLLAGKIMLESGAETYRVEDTMMRMAQAFGAKESHSYVTPTGIIFSIESEQPTKTKLFRITNRTTDLHKVTLVNSISRKITSNELTMVEAYHALKEIEKSGVEYSVKLQVLAAAIASGCFLIMFQGTWVDFLPAVIAGGTGLVAFILAQSLVPIKFFAEFVASLIIALLSLFFVTVGWGFELDKIIIGSVMPLVPGLVLTNAVRDLMAGHLVSGLSKGAEALLTAFAIGSGVAVVLTFL